MFGRKNPPKKQQLKLEMDSHISLNLIDVAHIELHPSFIRPDGLFFIQALGTVESTGGHDFFNVYAENNGNFYLIEIEAKEHSIESLALYQNALTLMPNEEEWKDLLKEMSSLEMGLDEIYYKRALGGAAKRIDLCKINEHIKTNEGEEVDCENQTMIFERVIEPFGFTERLKVTAEVIEAREEAVVSFYVGFNLHPTAITILGN